MHCGSKVRYFHREFDLFFLLRAVVNVPIQTLMTVIFGRKEWTDAEISALVQYICLFWDDAAWFRQIAYAI